MKIGSLMAAIFGLVALLLGGSYNSLVSKEEAIHAALGVVRTQEQRRFDLIPNLVRTVEGSADYERSVLTEVTQARARMANLLQTDASDLARNQELQKQFLQAQQQMSGALSRLIATAEAYPELRASEGFLTLQAQLEGSENRIAIARKDLQDVTQSYNCARRSFPFGRIAAALGGFTERGYFEASQEAQQPPQVQFNE